MFLKTGDYESGIETLVGAISLIKQSPTAAEERCQVRTTASYNRNEQRNTIFQGTTGPGAPKVFFGAYIPKPFSTWSVAKRSPAVKQWSPDFPV